MNLLGGPGRFYKGNIHAHSTASDGAHSADTVAALYRDAGYDFVAITDHFIPSFGFPVTDTRHLRRDGFTTILGAEVHAYKTELGEPWHILALGLPLDFAHTVMEEDGPALAARCAAANAFVTIVHPEWYGLTVADAESLKVAHAVEIYNHTSTVRVGRGDGSSLLDAMLARGHRLLCCAADDAHFKVADSFGGWVMVKAESLEPDAILAALKAGTFYSSQGPDIHAIGIDGDEIVVECSAAKAIIAVGRGSASESLLGTDLGKARLALAKFRKGGYFRVIVIDAEGRRAWSNPVWLAA